MPKPGLGGWAIIPLQSLLGIIEFCMLCEPPRRRLMEASYKVAEHTQKIFSGAKRALGAPVTFKLLPTPLPVGDGQERHTAITHTALAKLRVW